MEENRRPPIFDVPVEILERILRHIRRPRDYFNLAITCRGLWQYRDTIDYCVYLDLRRVRRPDPHHVGILEWHLSELRPLGATQRVVEAYVRHRPGHVQNAFVIAFAMDNLPAVQMMIEIGAVRPIAESGRLYLDYAVHGSSNLDIARWIVEQGVTVSRQHLYWLDYRYLARRLTPEYNWFQAHLSANGL
ncbi:hypothetical protein F5Y11DRAFT_348955 [Daldinia sp. FL1419]|nr:hypothetical protein F5Y11DRAFT_348955 [Daldinia sp. FL1419]